MILFFFCVALLLAGYFIYGALMVKVFGIKPQRPTPAHTHADGVDYVPMSRTKIWLIQLLNIAGTGPHRPDSGRTLWSGSDAVDCHRLCLCRCGA